MMKCHKIMQLDTGSGGRSSLRLPRCYFGKEKPESIQLHGFSDASKEAYGTVIYLRATYPTLQPTEELVISKSKVAPLATRSIPQLELCGANLLAKLMTTTRQTLEVPLTNTWAYTDSTIVLAWLDGQSKRYCIYSAHRIASTVALIPTNCWRHVPTRQNPADAASRGVKATELKDHTLWWHGPAWLATHPVALPVQPTEAHLTKMREVEAKPEHQLVLAVVKEVCFEENQNSYQKLIKIVCWTRRFIVFMKTKVKKGHNYLTTAEGQDATNILLQRSQQRSFPQEVAAAKATPPKELSTHSKLLILRPMMDETKLLRVGGRLRQTNYPKHQQHPIIISAKDHLTLLLFRHYHMLLGHCGPSTLMAHAANLYHVVGGRTLARSICSSCVVCRKQAAKASSQLLGQLPPPRVEPHYVFLHTGMDFAGPFPIKRGHTRRPTKIEAHLAVFICFVTRAVHLELVTDQTTQAFLAALDRFVDRSGLPLHLYSDNGGNYTGAKNKLKRFYKMLASKDCQDAVQTYAFDYTSHGTTAPRGPPTLVVSGRLL